PVDVQVEPHANLVVQPVATTVPRQGLVTVQIGNCGKARRPACMALPAHTSYDVVVRATRAVPFVAEDIGLHDQPRDSGAAAAPGSWSPAREWVFAGSRITIRGASLDLVNPGTNPASVAVSFVAVGRPPAQAGVLHLTVP